MSSSPDEPPDILVAAEETTPQNLILPPSADPHEIGPYGRPGKPVNRRTPFMVGLEGAFGVGVAYALYSAVSSVRSVLVLIVMALFLAIGLHPAVAFLQRRRMSKLWAVTVVMAGLLLGFGGFVATAVPALTSQAKQLSAQLPDDLQKLRSNATIRKLDDRYHFIEKIKSKASQGPTLGLKAVGGVLGFGKAVLGVLVSVITVVSLLIYFLANFEAMRDTGLRLVPSSRRTRVSLITDEILNRVGGYVLGNIATSLMAAVASLIVFQIVGVPYAIALALLVAIADLIPLVGATIGAVVCSAVAFFQGITQGIVVVIFFVIYQQLENHIVVPRVMLKTIAVPPVVTIVAALIGASLLGILGALLAIPIAAAVQLILSEVVFPRQEKT